MGRKVALIVIAVLKYHGKLKSVLAVYQPTLSKISPLMINKAPESVIIMLRLSLKLIGKVFLAP